MGAYKYIREVFKKKSTELKLIQRQRLIEWRKQNVVTSIDAPTNIVRARELGYRAKTGFVLSRVRLKRGGKKLPAIRKGRRTAHFGSFATHGKNYQRIAEERAAKHFPNLEVLNSYQAGKDGKHYFFEVILVDPTKPEIINDNKINWICTESGRAFRGLTSAGKRGRGLHKKGEGTERSRPSLRANKKLGK